MHYRAIVAESWKFTQENKKLIKWFAFLPALINVLFFTAYSFYQVMAIINSPLWDPNYQGHFFTEVIEGIWDLGKLHPGPAVFAVVILAIFGIAYFMLPPFTQGILIQWTAKVHAGEKLNMLDGISLGFRRFLQLFEYHLLIRGISSVGIFMDALLVIRTFGREGLGFFVMVFAFLMIVGFILTLLFTYADFFIALKDEGILNSMMRSAGLVLMQWHHTLFMLILMALISLRTLINIVVAFLVPVLVVGPILLFASVTLTTIGVIVGSLLGLVAIYFAAYFVGVFHVFSTAVWTFTFQKLVDGE